MSAFIAGRVDLLALVSRKFPHIYEDHDACLILVQALQSDDHPDYGSDWGDWLEECWPARKVYLLLGAS